VECRRAFARRRSDFGSVVMRPQFCRHTTSQGSARASQRAKPRRSAERMPLTLRVMTRMEQ
jgi:hypothetical protein